MQNRLKQIRVAINLQQGEFADKLGIHQQQLSKYERGENKPSYDFFIKLGEIFNVNINWLLTGQGSMFLPGNCSEDENTMTIHLRKGQMLKVVYEE